MTTLKKIIALMISVVCIVSLSFAVLADNHTSTPVGTLNGSLIYNYNDGDQVNAGSHTCRYRVSSFTFHGGLPANTFPDSSKNFTIRFYNIGVSRKYTTVDTNFKTKTYSVSSKLPVYAGIQTNFSNGITAFVSWNPNY